MAEKLRDARKQKEQQEKDGKQEKSEEIVDASAEGKQPNDALEKGEQTDPKEPATQNNSTVAIETPTGCAIDIASTSN